MATNRYINTNFWKDNYIAELDPIEKLLFNYFLTNSRTNIAGAYEINLREVAFDTGIDKDMVQKIVNRFEKDGKMTYRHGYIVIRNWIKHQQLNPSIIKGIDRYLNLLPEQFHEFIMTDDRGYKVGIAYDSLSTGSIQGPTYINNKSKLQTINNKLELESNPNVATATEGIVETGKKVTTKELDGMFQYWEHIVGYALTSRIKQNREYAGKLLHEYTKEDIAKGINTAAKASEDQYAPRIANFIDLYRKWDDLKLWDKRGTRQTTKVGRGFKVS